MTEIARGHMDSGFMCHHLCFSSTVHARPGKIICALVVASKSMPRMFVQS